MTSEKELMQAILDLARMKGWRCIHQFDSRRTAPGWPDIFCVRGEQAVAIETKSESGRLTPEQTAWLDDLGRVPGIRSFVVRPAPTLDRVAEILR